LQDGMDPIRERKRSLAQVAAQAAASMTFNQCAEEYIKAHKPSWRNEKHAQQWTNTLTTYAEPILGKLSVRDIDTRPVMKIIEPIWKDKRETASRIRGRIEVILDWAAVQGYRDNDNPARWKGKIDKLLPGRSRTNKVQHHVALAYTEIPSFMAWRLDLEDSYPNRMMFSSKASSDRAGLEEPADCGRVEGDQEQCELAREGPHRAGGEGTPSRLETRH
jgi:hypothetical protein